MNRSFRLSLLLDQAPEVREERHAAREALLAVVAHGAIQAP